MAQGRRKLLKVGRGPGFEGHFSNKKWHGKNFYRKCWRRIYHIFPKYEKNFTDIQKNFTDIWYFSQKWKQFSGNKINSSFQKCPLGKKCNCNNIFHATKRALCSRKKGTWQNLGGGASPPGSYAPDIAYHNTRPCDFT
jgi:hypothetical protein